MQSGWQAVAHHNDLAFARATNREFAFTICRRFNRPFLRKDAFRLCNRAKEFTNPSEHFFGIKLTRYRQHSVVWLIVAMVESLKVRDFNVFDVATRTDRASAIAMPVKEDGLHALHQHAHRAVFAHFVFVTHDGHFGIEVLLRNERIDHRVSLPTERPLHVVITCRKRHVIVRTV